MADAPLLSGVRSCRTAAFLHLALTPTLCFPDRSREASLKSRLQIRSCKLSPRSLSKVPSTLLRASHLLCDG